MPISLGDAILHLRVDNTGLDAGLKTTQSKVMSALKGFATGAGIALGAGVAGLAAVRQAYDRVIVPLQAYAAEVRDLSLLTGQSAEESSRLIQVLDDFEITTGDLTVAMRQMRQQGINPTVAELARMSDEYLTLNPGLERQNYLAENFGARTGQQFALVMEQGAAAILGLSAAVKPQLILTDEMIRKTEELRLAQDDLNDSVEAMKTGIATMFIPAVTDAVDVSNIWIDSILKGGNVLEILQRYLERRAIFDAFGDIGRDIAGGWDEGQRAINAVADAVRGIPTSHTTTLNVDADAAIQELDAFMARLTAAGIWTSTGVGGFAVGAGGRTIIGGGGGGGGGGGAGGHGYWSGGVFHPTATLEQAQAALRTGGQRGLSFDVEGPSGSDQVPVDLALTRGEHVEVTPEGEQGKAGGRTLHIGQVIINSGLDQQAFNKMAENWLRA
jgi:hypothetical protein